MWSGLGTKAHGKETLPLGLWPQGSIWAPHLSEDVHGLVAPGNYATYFSILTPTLQSHGNAC